MLTDVQFVVIEIGIFHLNPFSSTVKENLLSLYRVSSLIRVTKILVSNLLNNKTKPDNLSD